MPDCELASRIDCGTCGARLVCRMSDYGGRFPDRKQWQDEDTNTAHMDKNGDCKHKPKDEGSQSAPNPKPKEEPKKKENELDLPTKKMVVNESMLLFQIRKEVEATIKEVMVEPHPGMIWQMTELIWKKYYGALEN